ncbi:MAG: hypothetical protein FWE95_07635, partial [Planctomycetaceae bacterium]|nr:hypothetical protein [Planctomycetaceae bacterium]
GGGAEHWQWIDRGCVQKLGKAEVEANGSLLEGAKSEPNRSHLRRTLLRALGRLLEKIPLNVDVPADAPMRLSLHRLCFFCQKMLHLTKRSPKRS